MQRLLLHLLVIVGIQAAYAQDHYLVRFDEDLAMVAVEACFDGSPPVRLYHHSEASRFVQSLSTPAGKLRLQRNSTSTRLPELKPDSCISWQLDLDQATAEPDSRLAMRIGEAIVSDGDLWFWRGSGARSVQIEVELPAGMRISVPWRQIGQSDGGTVFQAADTPASWTSRIAVGHFTRQTLNAGNAEIRVAILATAGAPEQEKLTRWIKQAVVAVAGVYGRFPLSSLQVLIIPVGARSNPVPWAHVMRGGGVSAEFFVDETRPLKELSEDWTACHELSHLLLPFISRQDRWLSEGLASYYQYILLARSGMLTERQAWQGLFDGINRGENGTQTGRHASTLAEATLEGRENTMRIYWSGAAMMLMADTRLRAASGNQQSLDTALSALQTCCLDGTKRWRAEELFKRLDYLTGRGIFGALYDEYVFNEKFPDLSHTWKSLAIDVRSNRVRLHRDQTGSNIRNAIMKN